MDILNIISERVSNNSITNDELVEIIELCGSYLNIKTVSSYAKHKGISYQGALKGGRKTVLVFGVKMIIENE